jgi:hypothetical protein
MFFLLALLSSDGGDGFALYSVRARPDRLGVLCGVRGVYVEPLGVSVPFVPFTWTSPFAVCSIGSGTEAIFSSGRAKM